MAREFFIVNPASRGGKNAQYQHQIRAWAARYLQGAEVHETRHPGHATQLALTAARRGFSAIISVGGDGTLNEVINGVAQIPPEQRPSVATVARGTGGDFSRRLHELYPVPKDLGWLQNPGSVSVDLGRLTLWDDRGQTAIRYFINIADVGLAGEVTRRVNSSDKWLGSLEYLRSTLLGALSYRPPRVRITGFHPESGNPPTEMDLLIFILANGRYFGGGMCIAPDAVWDDGEFQIIAAPKISYWSLLAQLPRVYRKQRFRHEKVLYGRGKKVRLEALRGSLPVDVDGEYFEGRQVEFEILPKALKMLVAPAGAQGG